MIRALEGARTKSGRSIVELSEAAPVLLLFLRYAGCPFCRETLSDIAHMRKAIEASGTQIVMVHQGDEAAIGRLLARHGLSDLEAICDAKRELYRAFGLKRGGLFRMFGWKAMRRGVLEGAVIEHGFGLPAADVAQMPGVFLISAGEVLRRFRHQSVADRPNYIALCGAKRA